MWPDPPALRALLDDWQRVDAYRGRAPSSAREHRRGNWALGVAPKPERHDLAPTGNERVWRIVISVMAVLAVVVVALLA